MVGRPSKYKSEYNEQTYKLCLLGAKDSELASFFCVSEVTINAWKKTEQEFLMSLKRGKQEADMNVASSLYKRAMGFEYDEVIRERIDGKGQKKRHISGETFTFTNEEWEDCLSEFEYECAYCGSTTEIQKDHVIPIAKGGCFTKNNIVPACKLCNSGKKDYDLEKWYRKSKKFCQKRLEKITIYIEKIIESGDVVKELPLSITKVITKLVLPDVTAQIFWLKNRKADQWRDKQREEMDDDLKDRELELFEKPTKSRIEQYQRFMN